MKAAAALYLLILFWAVAALPVAGQTQHRLIGENAPADMVVYTLARSSLSEARELMAGVGERETGFPATVAEQLSRSPLGGTAREESLLVQLCSVVISVAESEGALPEPLTAVLALRLNRYEDSTLRRYVLLGMAAHPRPEYAGLLAERGSALVATFSQSRSRASSAARAEAAAYLAALRSMGNSALAQYAAGIAEHARRRSLVEDARSTGRALLQ